jgi:prolipoprotein diacylglyceryltransferase
MICSIVRGDVMRIIIQHWLISPYAICFFAAYFASCGYLAFELGKAGVEKKYIAYSFAMTTVFSLYGGAVYTIAAQYISSGTITGFGFSGMGGVIGLLLGVWIFTKIYREHTAEICSTYIMSLGLLYSVSKLGCFFAGCCFGREYSGIFCVTYIDQGLESVPRVPVQLFESVLFLAAFLAINVLYRRHPQRIVSVSLLTYSLLKFILDFLRYYEDRQGLSINQKVILLILLLYFCIWLLRKKNNSGRMYAN